MVHPDIPIIGTTLASPINRGGVPRFLDGSLGDFGCCKAINDIRRYTSVKGIVVRQVGADAESTTDVVGNTSLHARATSISKVTSLVVVTDRGSEFRRNAVAHINTLGI